MNFIIGCIESSFGFSLKYKEALKKCFVLSVNKNCEEEAVFPSIV
jgi:hypothetical protein